MSRSIGVFIEHDEVVAASEENKSLFVIFKFQGLTKDTFFHLTDFLDVFFSPGRYNEFHYLLIMLLINLLGLK